MPRLDTLFATDEPSTLGEFLTGWARTRPYQLAMAAVPAVLLAMPLMLVVLRLPFVNSERLGRRYHLAAINAWKDERPKEARLYFGKAQALMPKIPEVQYAHAILAAENEDAESALNLMRKLAPLDEAGYPPAHQWQVQQLWRGALNSPEQAKEIEKHLNHIRAQVPDDLMARRMLVALYEETDRKDDAISLIGTEGEHDPWLWYTAARMHDDADRQVESREFAKQVFDHFAVKDMNQLSVEDYIVWAETLIVAQQFGNADQVLSVAARHFPDERRFAATKAKNCRTWADAIKPDSLAIAAEKLRLMQYALLYDASDVKLLQQIERITNKSNAAAEQARRYYRKLLARGKAQGITHLVLGILAHRQGEKKLAGFHFDRANGVGIPVPVVLARLSVATVKTPEDGGEFDTGLIDLAVNRWPEKVEIREARAVVLSQLERYPEAVEDLELVLAKYPDRKDLQRLLNHLNNQIADVE